MQPVISEYLERFERHLASRGFSGSFSLMQSNGGRLPSTGMRRNPVTALFSGPAAGVMGAVRQSVQSGFTSLITFDMGGTSTDVCLIQDGEPELTGQSAIDGLPVRTPLFDIVSVGAGCGSIVWRDEGGMLRVGPQSAGADPGPACYGRGGDLPTITDAHIIQGTIRPDAFLGGAMSIDEQASHRVFEDIAGHFGLPLPEMADSAIRVADANIVRAIQLVSTERGRDPRDYVLVAFGGAGPLHAARVAEDLDIGTILVPPYAGVLSAYGLLASDYRLFETRTRRILVDEEAPAVIRDTVAEMRGRIEEQLRDMGLGNGDRRMHLTLEMRFVGQAFEVPVDIDPGNLDELTARALLDAFIDAHHRMYLYGAANRTAAEIVSFRLGAVSPVERVPRLRESRGDIHAPPRRHRIFDGRESVDCTLVQRASLAAGQGLEGPGIIDDVSSTIFVPAGWRSEAGYKVYHEVIGGGYGASARADGCSGVDGPLGNCSNVPVESLDMDFDFFRVREYSLIPDSGGGGAFRGGLGIRRRYEILADEVQYAQYGDRFRFQPDGLFGGEPGAAASCNIEREGEITELASKESAWLRSGDVLTVSTGGGGGYGAPDGRSAERIDDDAAQRRTSARPTSSFERTDAEIAK